MEDQPTMPARESALSALAHDLRPGRLVTAMFDGLARIRHGRVVHPRGVLLDGDLVPQPGRALPFPTGSQRIVARLSKGAGTPGGAPDVLGLALRIPTGPGLAHPWDITLASSRGGRLGRILLMPSVDWANAHYSSIAPYRLDRRWWWLLAEADDDQPSAGAELAELERFAQHRPLHFTLFEVSLRGRRRVAAELFLNGVRTDVEHPSFDPMWNRPPGIHLSPRWLSTIREFSYHGSRMGRRRSRR